MFYTPTNNKTMEFQLFWENRVSSIQKSIMKTELTKILTKDYFIQ